MVNPGEIELFVAAEDRTNDRAQIRRFEAWLLSSRERKSSDSPAVVNDSVTSTACSELGVFPGGMCALVGTRQRVHRGRWNERRN